MKWYFHNFFTWHGRTNRGQYIVQFMSVMLLSLICAVGVSAFMPTYENAPTGILIYAALIIFASAGLMAFGASILMTIRRMHDLGKSGWYYLAVIIVLMLTELLSSTLSNVLSVAFFAVLLFVPGTNGENRFGVSPHILKEAK